MSEPRFTLTCGRLSHGEALALADLIEQSLAIDALAVSVNEVNEERAEWETIAWFATEVEAPKAKAALGLPHAVIAAVEQRDWVAESLKGLAPVSAGRFFIHGSHDRAIRRAGGISLEIDAGTAFGTGHHGTTLACLRALDHLLKSRRPQRVLDLGTGTGLLALAAAKATRRDVMGTDIDAEAVRVARENFRSNQIGPLLRPIVAAGLHDRRIHAEAPFDLIFANILAKPLARLATGLTHLLAPGGTLVLSGLTLDQERWIRALYIARGLHVQRVLAMGNWAALVLRKPSRFNSKTRQRFSRHRVLHEAGSGYAEGV